MLKPEATLWGVANIPRNGDYLEPDKLYDSNFGGYYHNEVFYKPAKGKTEKRWVANNLSQASKNLNRIFGLSLQNKQSLTKKELAEYKDKMKRIQESRGVRYGLH